MNELFSSVEKWIDYLDGGFNVLGVTFDLFQKELVLSLKVSELNKVTQHEIRFMNVASLYYNGGEGNDRFEELIHSYHPNGMLLAIESKNVCFDSQEFICSV
ncbi:YxiG family protein [Bacillus altitudinis]|uniref:YxiG family protein n=1 Tax=Bacillus TaxID=1386 RepID=UPI00406A4CC3